MVKKLLKNITVVLMSVSLAAALVACGTESKSDDADKKDTAATATEAADKDTEVASAKVDFTELSKAMISSDATMPDMTVLYGTDDLAADYFAQVAEDFDYDKVDNFFFAYAEAGSPETIAVVYVKDAADTSKCEKGLRKAVDSRIDRANTYAPEQVDVLDSAEIYSEGNYVVLIIGGNSDSIKAAFEAELAK